MIALTHLCSLCLNFRGTGVTLSYIFLLEDLHVINLYLNLNLKMVLPLPEAFKGFPGFDQLKSNPPIFSQWAPPE